MNRRFRILAASTALGALVACQDQPNTPSPRAAALAKAGAESFAVSEHIVGDVEALMQADVDGKNAALEASGSNVRVLKAEFMVAPDGPAEAGTTVYANNRTHGLPYFWVAGDERRDADGDKLTYLVDDSQSYAFTRASFPNRAFFGDSFGPSFSPWTGLTCGKLNVMERPDAGGDYSIVFDYDANGQWDPQGDPYAADIVVAGWRRLPAGVLGVAYTFIFVDDLTGEVTDVNGDGRLDTALVEVWYSDRYYWGTDGASNAIDFLSVAIHENGHALGIAHFGKVFVTNANGKLHFAPQAIMNAVYVSAMRQLMGTDKASYCQNFSNWPN